jgi:hypothetical protein
MTIAKKQLSESHSSVRDKPTPDLWQPRWLVDVGQEIMAAIAMDDGCYVVLTQAPTGQWKPMTHIPVEAAKMLGRLAGG